MIKRKEKQENSISPVNRESCKEEKKEEEKLKDVKWQADFQQKSGYSNIQ